MQHFLSPSFPKQSFSKYKNLDLKTFKRVSGFAGKIKGLNIFHISSTAHGGGVVELLKNQIPLENSLGLKSHWRVIKGQTKFFSITKKIHNLMQGQKGGLEPREKNYYLKHLEKPGKELEKFLLQISGPAVVVLHDPQVLPLIDFIPARFNVIVRLHIDLSEANAETLKFLSPFLKKAAKVIVSHKQFAPNGLGRKQVMVSYPAINPFSEKNAAVPAMLTDKFLKQFKINPRWPLIAQISRFDVWKDPEGVIKAYYLAKKHIPQLQLVLEGVIEAKDDPEAKTVYKKLNNRYKNDPQLFLRAKKTLQGPLYEKWVNALQTRADVVIQKSIKEGFGLTVTEALWKGKAVIGGPALGIKLQIKNGVNGFIVHSPKECAKRLVELLQNPKLAERLGQSGKAYVKKNFLMNRLIFDFLRLYADLKQI